MLTEAPVLVPGVSSTKVSKVVTCSEQHLGWKCGRVSCCDYTSQVIPSSGSVAMLILLSEKMHPFPIGHISSNEVRGYIPRTAATV